MLDIIANRYVLIGEGARTGGLSTVRKATDQRSGQLVAVKLLSGPQDEVLQKLFERESVVLKSLNHPNIIQLHDSGADEDGTYYLVFDWIEESLAGVLTTGEPYDWLDLAENVALPLLEALAYAHLRQAEHRDIKPGNILLRDDGSPVLADFGISKLRSDLGHSELTVANFRSRPYAPPEEDSSVPYVRDVYSMGVVLLQALHKEKLRDFSDIDPALGAVRVPPQVRRLLESCVHHERTRRPPNGSALLEEFKRATIATAGGVAQPPTIHIRLTARVRTQLLDGGAIGDLSEADAAVDRDLSTDVFAQFRLDSKTGKIDRDTILLTGTSWRFTLKLADDRRSFVAVMAKQYDFEALESMRRRSLETGSLMAWTCKSSRSQGAEVALDKLQRILDDFEDSRNASRAKAGFTEEDNLFDKWLRLLQAQEEVARGDLRPFRYSDHVRRGREADFVLSSENNTDLLGSEMEVIVEESSKWLARGEVIAQGDGELTLRSERAFPRLPPRGLLTPFLGPTQSSLQRQRDAVSAVRDGTGARPDLSSLIVDPAGISEPIAATVSEWQHDIDASKQKAVEAALGARDLILIQGPPGTGKTTLIAETVAQLVKGNPRVRILIVSQTHVAVDNALDRLSSAGLSRMVRLAAKDDPRVSESVRPLLLDQQMPRWAASLRKKAEAFLGEKSSAAGIPPDHLRAALALQQLIQVNDQIAVAQRRIVESPEGDGSSRRDPNAIFDASSPQEKLDRLTEQRGELIRDAHRSLAGDLTLNSEMTQDDARAAVEALVGRADTGHDLLRILALQADWLQRVASDENLASAFLQTSNVIAGTCIGFLRHPAVRDLEIDLCILDEASKATATEALVPMARAKKWILIGDTNQLPPMDEEVLRRPQLMAEHDLDADFVSETLFQRIANDVPDHSSFLLTEQHRMIRPIGDMISTCFYKGNLSSPRTEGLRGYDLLGKAVTWIDTKSLRNDRREDAQIGGGKSFANRAEAGLVMTRLEVIDAAIEKGFVGVSPSGGKLEVLLISPYQLQVEELKRRLSTASHRNLTVDVQSVDAVQGRESDLAIFSVTRSNAAGALGFIGEDFWRRINVALSRAKFGLTIVGDANFCRDSPGALRQVLKYIDQNPQDCELRG